MRRICKGYKVRVTAGKDKGKEGKVLQVKDDRVLVEGINIVKKHTKPNPNLNITGGIIEQPAFLHISNVALINPKTNKVGKVGFKLVQNEDGTSQKVRYFKSNDELVDVV